MSPSRTLTDPQGRSVQLPRDYTIGVITEETERLLDQLAVLLDRLGGQTHTVLRGYVERLVDDPDKFLLGVFRGTTLIGTVELGLGRPGHLTAGISNLAVTPDHWNRGLASALLEYAEALAAERGCAEVYVRYANACETSLKLYLDRGYVGEEGFGLSKQLVPEAS